MKSQKYATPVMVIATIVISLAMLLIPTSHRQNEAGDDRLDVVVTIIPFADFVRQVGGDMVDIDVMVPRAPVRTHTNRLRARWYRSAIPRFMYR